MRSSHGQFVAAVSAMPAWSHGFDRDAAAMSRLFSADHRLIMIRSSLFRTRDSMSGLRQCSGEVLFEAHRFVVARSSKAGKTRSSRSSGTSSRHLASLGPIQFQLPPTLSVFASQAGSFNTHSPNCGAAA